MTLGASRLMDKNSLRSKNLSITNSLFRKIEDISRQLDTEGLFKIKEITDKQEFENIRDKLTYWSNKRRFIFVSNLGKKIKIDRLIIEKSYIGKIQTLLVKRTLHTGMRAYRDEDISLDEYLPASLYDLPYKSPPDDFNEGKETEQILPGSENITKCDRCLGKGKVSGRAGYQACPACEGSGEVVRYVYYETQYFPKLFTGFFSPVKIPQKQMIKEAGDYIYDEIIYDRMENIENAWIKLAEFGYLNSAIEKLLNYMKEILKKEEDIAIFRIRLSVQGIKLKKVEYTFRNRRQFLWMNGNNDLLYTKKKFIDWRKLFLMISAGLIILINSLFYTTKTGYFSPKSGQKIPAIKKPSEKKLIAKPKAKTVEKEKIAKPEMEIVTVGRKEIIKKDKEELVTKKTILRRKYLFNKGFSQFKAGEFENAFNNLKAAIELDKVIKNHSKIVPTTADLYFYLGETLMKFENYDEAIIAYENTLKYNPDHYFAKERLKKAKSLKGRFEKTKNYEEK